MDCADAVYSNDYYDFIAEYNTVMRNGPNVRCVQTINEFYDAIYVNREGLLPLGISNYSYTAIPKCFALMDKSALEVSGITRIQNYPTLSLRGQGVLIGFVDTGIDYQNPVFKNADGSTRITAIWDQTERSGTPPQGFLYGSEYQTEDINLALENQKPETIVPSRDTQGHGTFLASVAAGSNIPGEDFSGGAPYAQIAVVKLKQAKENLRDYFFIPYEADAYQENDIMAGIAYLDQLASRKGMPLVMCLGLGSNMGSHGAVTTPLAAMLDYTGVHQQRAMVLAAGNEGNQRHHFLGVVPEEEEYQNVEISVGTDVTGFVVELWGSAPQLFVVEIVSPTGERVPKEFILSGGTEYTFVFEKTKVSIDYRIAGISSADQLIYMRFENPVQGIWNIRVYRQAREARTYHMWLPIRELMSGDVYFIRSNPDNTITAPGNAYVSMTATAYDVRDNSLYINAGRGYTVNGIIKPDFAAPGVEVYGAGLRNRFVTRSGTSVAAAVAAGAVALLMEWAVVRGYHTSISGTEIKNILIRGTEQEPERNYPNREWGWGRLNLYDAFEGFRVR